MRKATVSVVIIAPLDERVTCGQKQRNVNRMSLRRGRILSVGPVYAQDTAVARSRTLITIKRFPQSASNRENNKHHQVVEVKTVANNTCPPWANSKDASSRSEHASVTQPAMHATTTYQLRCSLYARAGQCGQDAINHSRPNTNLGDVGVVVVACVLMHSTKT